MNPPPSPREAATTANRREFLKTTGRVAAVSALAGVTLPHVHAADSQTVQVALIGCGGRGTGAANDALSTKGGPIKLTAMADVFADKLARSHESLQKAAGERVEVTPEKKFIGFAAYKQAMDALRPGDIAILATPVAFRWLHFAYAIEKGLHVFMEKPVTVDGPTTRRMIELAAKADAKNLKVGVGLMVRHCRARQELWQRLRNGEIGDILALRAYRMHAPVGREFVTPRVGDDKGSELLWQIHYFHSFLWASGGLFSDYYIHQIDECCWMKDAWPVKASALGARHQRGGSVDQNFDHYGVEYTFEDGAKLFFNGRVANGCKDGFDSYAHGTKGMAVISSAGHTPGRCRIFKGQTMSRSNLVWSFPQPEKTPYQLEWDDLLDAIRENKPYNEVKRGAMASLVTSLGRMAAHTGQEITLDEILNSDHEFAPDLAKLTPDGPAPLLADANGKYPIPQPGVKKTREY